MSNHASPETSAPALLSESAVPEIVLSDEDREALRRAMVTLEGPSFAARLAALAGRPIELLGRALPQAAADLVSDATRAALERALRYALKTIPADRKTSEDGIHKVLAALSGAMGGALGGPAVLVELPISTTIMLRSIARIAQNEGEDLSDPEVSLACLQVFALGGRSGSDNFHESGYFAVRAAMARSVSRALQQVAGRGLVDGSSAIARLISQIGARFGAVVSQKLAAQAVPVLGAIGGAAINTAFVDHFQAIARAHFTVRRVERIYGQGTVRREYDRLRKEAATAL